VTPEQEEQVARALAETARHHPTGPIPAAVSARLDDVLADLVAPRAADAGSGATTVGHGDELAAARRRRRPQLLAAAAAVSVIALAGAAVATGGFGTSRSGSGAEDTAASRSNQDSAGKSSEDRSPESSTDRSLAADASGTPLLRTASLARDVEAVVDRGLPPTGRRQLAVPAPGKKPSAARPCLTPPTRPGERLVPVRLDGRPATLLLEAERDGLRTARVYSCVGATTPLAQTSVRTR
jgi:hypothetical protein